MEIVKSFVSLPILGRNKNIEYSGSGSSKSGSSSISTVRIENFLEKLMMTQHRGSTTRNYLSIWRQFNKFIISLDRKPKLWEDRATLFMAYLIDKGRQSSTIKAYLSEIKKTLVMDKYEWKDELVLVRSLTRACRIINDCVRTRLPIQCTLLEMILFEVQRYFGQMNQWYLVILYKALFAISYYGLLRVGEVTYSPHVLQARDVQIGTNKDKIQLVLYSSKTHDTGSRPQKIKIVSNSDEVTGSYAHRHFCPFKLMTQYRDVRGPYSEDVEQFFIYRDGSPVKPDQVRKVLKIIIARLNFDQKVYGMHSFRIGRATDLIRYGYTIEEVMRMGRWRSNVVFKYIR